MTQDTNTASGAADMLELIEAYAEARQRQGHSSYNAQTSAALQAVKAALAAGQATAAQQSGAKLNYSVLYVYANQHGIDYNSLCVAVREASAQPAAQQGVAYAALPDEREMLKHALWLASSFTVHRYLMSNAEGRWSGAEKATCHDELCCLYVAVFRGVEVDRVRVDLEADWMAVHDATQELTDHMDVVIGFPLKGVPDYEELAPKFFAHFHRLAACALRASHGQAPAQPVDFTTLGAAMRAIQQAIELIGTPTDERMRAVRRVLRGAVIVAEDDGKVAPLPSTVYAALPEKYYLAGGEVPTWDAKQIHAFADATHTLRTSHGQAPAGAGEPTEQQILEAAFAPAQPAPEASRFGSPELQAMIIARCVEKDRADSVQEDAAREAIEKVLALFPFNVPIQKFTVNNGPYLTADNDDEFYSVKRVLAFLTEIKTTLDAARKQGEKQ